ncbi:hypothetical protein EG68_11500 [Paragonimus skrjabini miyazakii]|uniref:Uncharacterized protein n=1 Tax=Paragonimus skrjabini miyazakii TaxID=59628 RepID=A0A8S9YLS1_9TREM|nr:hypothetical protein EG68_11500 [Paragonimus skrjabini miyazakii]
MSSYNPHIFVSWTIMIPMTVGVWFRRLQTSLTAASMQSHF